MKKKKVQCEGCGSLVFESEITEDGVCYECHYVANSGDMEYLKEKYNETGTF